MLATIAPVLGGPLSLAMSTHFNPRGNLLQAERSSVLLSEHFHGMNCQCKVISFVVPLLFSRSTLRPLSNFP